MVMKTAEAAGSSTEVTHDVIGEDSNDGQRMPEPVNTRKRILEKATFDDLEAPEAKRSTTLSLSKTERYFTGPTPVSSQDYLTHDEAVKARINLQQELKAWQAQRNPNVLSSSAAVSNFIKEGYFFKFSPSGTEPFLDILYFRKHFVL